MNQVGDCEDRIVDQEGPAICARLQNHGVGA